MNVTPQLIAALALLAGASACARKQQPASPTPAPAGDAATDPTFEDDAAFDDAFADDPGLEPDLAAFEEDAGVSAADAAAAEATAVGAAQDQAAATAKAQQTAMLVQSLPAMMQAVTTGNPQALMPMFTQMITSQLGASGGTGGQIMAAAGPLIGQAMAGAGGGGASAAQQQAAAQQRAAAQQAAAQQQEEFGGEEE